MRLTTIKYLARLLARFNKWPNKLILYQNQMPIIQFSPCSPLQENGLLWFVIMDKISAQSYDEAMRMGKDAVQKASISNQTNAEKGSWGAISGDMCSYGPGEIYTLGVHMNLLN